MNVTWCIQLWCNLNKGHNSKQKSTRKQWIWLIVFSNLCIYKFCQAYMYPGMHMCIQPCIYVYSAMHMCILGYIWYVFSDIHNYMYSDKHMCIQIYTDILYHTHPSMFKKLHNTKWFIKLFYTIHHTKGLFWYINNGSKTDINMHTQIRS